MATCAATAGPLHDRIRGAPEGQLLQARPGQKGPDDLATSSVSPPTGSANSVVVATDCSLYASSLIRFIPNGSAAPSALLPKSAPKARSMKSGLSPDPSDSSTEEPSSAAGSCDRDRASQALGLLVHGAGGKDPGVPLVEGCHAASSGLRGSLSDALCTGQCILEMHGLHTIRCCKIYLLSYEIRALASHVALLTCQPRLAVCRD